MNPGPLECEAGVLTILPQRSVLFVKVYCTSCMLIKAYPPIDEFKKKKAYPPIDDSF
jgi:hypothetical protein